MLEDLAEERGNDNPGALVQDNILKHEGGVMARKGMRAQKMVRKRFRLTGLANLRGVSLLWKIDYKKVLFILLKPSLNNIFQLNC